MNIRIATVTDLNDLVRLNDQIQRQHAEQYPEEFKYPANSKEVAKFFATLIESDTDTVLVASNETGVYAYLYYEIQRIPENTFKYAKSRYYIHHVLVDSSVRRSGTASALFAKVEGRARPEGIAHIALDTWMLNKEAHDFFEWKGFTVTQLLFSKMLN
ncbi:MAG: GNAT family N-acetyltransferase [Pseudomonadales bacterium]